MHSTIIAMKDSYIENEFAELWIEDGIVFFTYKPDKNIDLSAAKKIVSDRVSMQKNNTMPVFCDLRGLKEMNKEARDYMAKDGSNLVKTVAVLIGSPVTKIMLNFYMSINQPITPTRMFTDKDKALEYLQPLK